MSVENTDIFSKFLSRGTFLLAPTATANTHLPPFSSPARYQSAFFSRPLLRRAALFLLMMIKGKRHAIEGGLSRPPPRRFF